MREGDDCPTESLALARLFCIKIFAAFIVHVLLFDIYFYHGLKAAAPLRKRRRSFFTILTICSYRTPRSWEATSVKAESEVWQIASKRSSIPPL